MAPRRDVRRCSVGCSINTVDKLLRDAGEIALAYHDEYVRGVKASLVQCDEIWSFVAVKQKNRATSTRATDPTAGDCWTWTAIEAQSKLLISYLVGARCGICADADGRSSRPTDEPSAAND